MRQMILRILDIKRQRTVILRQETNKVSATLLLPLCLEVSLHHGVKRDISSKEQVYY